MIFKHSFFLFVYFSTLTISSSRLLIFNSKSSTRFSAIGLHLYFILVFILLIKFSCKIKISFYFTKRILGFLLLFLLMSSSKKDLIDRISILIDEKINEKSAIKGISVGTNMGTNLYTKLDSDLLEFSGYQLIASATSFQSIAGSLFHQLTNNKISSNYVTVEKYILIMNIVKDVSGAAILDRKFAELEGIDKIQKDFKILMQKIATHIETSDYFFEDPFVKISQALPTALSLILVSIEGMPIKAIGLKGMSEPMVSSMVSSISSLTQVMMRSNLDYCIIEGEEALVIIVQYDPKRILAVCLPEQEKGDIGFHLATIKSIIKETEIL